MHSEILLQHSFPPLSVNHRFTFILVQEQGKLLSNLNKNRFCISDINGTQNHSCAFFSTCTFIFISGNLFAPIFCRKCSFLVLFKNRKIVLTDRYPCPCNKMWHNTCTWNFVTSLFLNSFTERSPSRNNRVNLQDY